MDEDDECFCKEWHLNGRPLVTVKEQQSTRLGVCQDICLVNNNNEVVKGIANAHLIAAPPDLYEALDKLASEISGCMGIAERAMREALGNTNYHCMEDRITTARAALAKARGEA